ncbi:MAG: 16S rRNA processing protein RimM [Thermoleophilaceae bacterium]|nr:16S rRNA processing protein RimM [Thermoleophilaceae bacterium]
MNTEGARPGPEWVRIGRVGKAHGYDGGFYGETPSFPGELSVGATVLVAGSERKVTQLGGTPKRPLLHISDCATREAAAALADSPIWLERSALTNVAEGEWFGSDLEGMAVTDGQNALGTVRRVVNAPSVDFLEVDTGADDDILVPVIGDAVLSVDLESRTVTVNRSFLGLD